MIGCDVCKRMKTSIEAANCQEHICPHRRPLALKGPLTKIMENGKTDPIKAASEMTIRERFAMEFAAARLCNSEIFKNHGGNFLGVAQDAVGWADAVIERLNGNSPPPPKAKP